MAACGRIRNAIGAMLDYPCHTTAEQTGDFIDGVAAVFDYVMQEPCDRLILVATMLDHAMQSMSPRLPELPRPRKSGA
jgi:hypothetical protein